MVCANCGLDFEADNFIGASPGTQVDISGSRVNCPRCGEMAEQRQSGVFEVDAAGRWRLLAEALRPADVTRDDYERLFAMLEAAQREAASPAELAAKIDDEAPAFSALGQWFLSGHGVAIATWLAVVIPVILWMLSRMEPPAPSAPPVVNVTVNVPGSTPSEEQIQQQIEQALKAVLDQPTTGRRAGRSPARNAPCPCGSGEKYKRCHGAS